MRLDWRNREYRILRKRVLTVFKALFRQHTVWLENCDYYSGILQNHRMPEAGRSTSRQLLDYLQGQRLHNFSGKPVPMLCQVKCFFPKLKFLFYLSKMLVPYFLLSCHGAPFKNSLAQSTLNPAFQYLYTSVSCCFTGIDSPSSQSLLTNVNL